MESLKAAAQRLAEETLLTLTGKVTDWNKPIMESAILEGMKLAMEEAAKVAEAVVEVPMGDAPGQKVWRHYGNKQVSKAIRAMKGETHD